MPSVAFISNVYIANSLRARILINLSAVSNIDLNFVLSIAFISDVYIADSLRARTLINLSAVLYKQAAARTSLLAKVSNIFLSAKVSIIDLNFVPSVAFDAIGNVELMGDLLGNADRVNNNNNNKRTASLAKRIKTNKDCKKSTHFGDNIEELIYVGKVKNNHNNLNIIVTNLTSREFGRVNMKSLTRLFISKLDKVPTRELSSYIKIELYPLRNNSRKFYYLVITSEDTHYKQTIKKAYIMLLERALLILFIT
ncbi:hypothetical protein HBH89_246890 [Parastagonospora nodorum]|nr:hypothetical protein HBH89_246890 [Parastagonospora nodorum]